MRLTMMAQADKAERGRETDGDMVGGGNLESPEMALL